MLPCQSATGQSQCGHVHRQQAVGYSLPVAHEAVHNHIQFMIPILFRADNYSRTGYNYVQCTQSLKVNSLSIAYHVPAVHTCSPVKQPLGSLSEAFLTSNMEWCISILCTEWSSHYVLLWTLLKKQQLDHTNLDLHCLLNTGYYFIYRIPPVHICSPVDQKLGSINVTFL